MSRVSAATCLLLGASLAIAAGCQDGDYLLGRGASDSGPGSAAAATGGSATAAGAPGLDGSAAAAGLVGAGGDAGSLGLAVAGAAGADDAGGAAGTGAGGDSGTNVEVALALADRLFCVSEGMPTDIKAVDLNRDDKLDLVVSNWASNDIKVFLGGGDGTFAAPLSFAVLSKPSSIALADFNGDGKTDVAVGHASDTDDQQVSVLLGRGDGTFEPEQLAAAGSFPTDVDSGDFDGDGNVDLVFADLLDDDVSVLLGKGDGTFGAPLPFAAGVGPVGVVVIDWDHDKKLDIAVSDQDFGVTVLIGNGAGDFAHSSIDDADFVGGRITTGDLNSDGRDDLIVADQHFGGGVQVMLSGATPTTALYLPTGWGPQAVTLVDLNQDGKLDVVATTGSTGAGDLALMAYLGNGDGSLRAPQSLIPYTFRNLSFGATAAGDFDGDGVGDLAVTSQEGLISILLNRSGSDAGAAPPPPNAGACSPRTPGGAEQIVRLWTGQSDPFGVAVDADNVYWTNFEYPGFGNGTVMKVAKTGDTPAILAEKQGSPSDIAVGSSNVYWTNYNGDSVMRVGSDGSGLTTIAATGSSPFGIQADENRVYWGDPDMGVLAAPLIGGSQQVFCCDSQPISSMTIDANNLYLAGGDIVQVPKNGSAIVPLTSSEQASSVLGLAVDAQNLYYVKSDGAPPYTGRLMTKSLSGADAPLELASGFVPSAVVTDGVDVYWLDAASYNGRILRTPVGGGSVTEIAWGLFEPARLAVDATHVYWTERLAGHVSMMAK